MAYEQLKLENQLCFPLYACAREVVKQYKPLLDEIGLTYTQYIAMMVLWEAQETNVKALGERLHLDSGTLTPLLKRLEAEGFITRARSATDERSVKVAPTQKSMELRELAAAIPAKVGACLPLSGEEAETLYRLLYKVMGSLAPKAGDKEEA